MGVGDREADIYELFVWANKKPGRPALLVRAQQDRLLAEGQGQLWDHLLSQMVALELFPPKGVRV